MEEITVVSVKPGFGEFDKINEIYEEAFPPAERKLTLEQMMALPTFKQNVNAYFCDGKAPGIFNRRPLGGVHQQRPEDKTRSILSQTQLCSYRV